jgi:hemicentin
MKNSEGEIISQAKLNVHTAPTIGSLPQKIEGVEGQQVIIPCKVSGHPKPEITFLKDKKDVTTLEDKSRFRIEHDEKTNEVRLIISNVKEEDQGKYTIRAKNAAQTVEEQTNLIVSAPLSFIDKLQDTDVISGQNLVLTCRCQGIPKPVIKWYQNDIEIKSTTKQKIESKPDATQTLTINRVDLTDGGVFKITATNSQGTVTSTCHVDVLTKPKIDSKPQDIPVNIGESAELNVKLSGLPKPNIEWLKNGQPFPIDNKRIKTIEKDDIYSLIIDNTQLDDKASYTLKATNKAGETESPKINLNVTAIKPSLKSDLIKDITAQIGETIPLTIKASGTKPKVKWYKNGEEIIETVEETYEIVEEEETYTLLIKNAKPKDTAEYQAVITNDVGQVKSKKIKVQVQKAPELKKKPQPVLTVKEGQQAQFECEFEGNPTPKVSWLRDGKPLTPKEGFDIKTDTNTGKSILTINQATSKHAGPITLRLENSVGTPIEEVVQLNVETPPQLLQKPQPTCEALINQTTIIPFKCSATPKPTIKLFKNDVQVPLNGDHYELVSNSNDITSYEIKIKNVRSDDEGNYRIRIENPLGNTESNVQVTTVDNITIKPSKPNKTDLKQHETLILEYFVEGKPKPDIIFTKDGKEIKPSSKTQITYDEKTKICRLTTTDVGHDDQGVYTLIAKNKLGKQETEQIKVNVTAPIVIKKKLPETIDGVFGEQTILTVEAEGIPQPKVTWYFNDQPIKTSPKYKIEIPKDHPNQTNLILPKLDTNDTGKYTAIIDNGLEKIETSTKLNVHTKPELLKDLNDSPAANTAKIGEKFVLDIRAQGKTPPQVIWLLNGQELSGNSSDYELVVTEDSFYRIVFHRFDERYLGEYQAIIKSIGGTIQTKTIRVIGQQAPIFTQAPPKFIQIKTGEKLTIECMAKGHPTPKITWLRDGKILSNKDGFDIKIDQNTGHSIFIIPQGTTKHSGKYECKVENQHGTHTAEINIEVLRKLKINLKDF